MNTVKNNPFVLITTEWRGVFAGYLESQDDVLRKVTLSRARCAIDWMTKNGFIELAQVGPNSQSKIGAEAPEATFYGVTSIVKCTTEAEQAWLSHPVQKHE